MRVRNGLFLLVVVDLVCGEDLAVAFEYGLLHGHLKPIEGDRLCSRQDIKRDVQMT